LPKEEGPSTPTLKRRARWLALAFVPSSLLLSFTTYLTTDLASVPLLWTLPLALYLSTFVFAFARRQLLPTSLWCRLCPFAIVGLLVLLLSRSVGPLWLILPIHLATFFVTAMFCHGELARDRPTTTHLTEFYLWIAMGGLLGGVLNALAAPLVFHSAAEYPLTLVLACFLLPRSASARENTASLVLNGLVPVCLAGIIAVVWGRAEDMLAPETEANAREFACALPVLGLLFLGRPTRFGLTVGMLTCLVAAAPARSDRTLLTARSFYGIHRVMLDPQRRFHELIHGTTTHGVQSLDPARRREPMAYFYRTGPLGQVFEALQGPLARKKIAVMGLGSGTMACYVGPGQHLTFYEIDSAVVEIARNPTLFTYLQDCPGKIDITLGDGRLTLAQAPAHGYDLIAADAFSSDSIPLHLLTREALQLYLSKLAPGGLIVFQISNRYVDLEPVLGDLAADAGLACLAQIEVDIRPEEWREGKTPSGFLIMARRRQDFGVLADDARWHEVLGRHDARIWTDDYSNILSVLEWQKLVPTW
jgi:hypothetical protein